MAPRESAISVAGFWFGVVSLLLALGAVVATQAAGQAKTEEKLTNLSADVAELKQDVKKLTSKTAAAEPSSSFVAQYDDQPTLTNSPKVLSVASDDWRDRFVADHCKRCPSCCIQLSTASLP